MRVSKACSEGMWVLKACRVCVSKVCRVYVGVEDL